jgi:hypothetical protein
MPITLNGTTGVVTPGATVGSITGILKATSGVVSQAVAGSDYGQLTLATAQTASGTAVDFTSIPSWAKRITVMFSGVSTNGSSNPLIQIGTSGGIQTTGYSSGGWTSNTNNSTSTTGFLLQGSQVTSYVMSGQAVLTLVDAATGIWAMSSILNGSSISGLGSIGGGNKTLSGTLDRLRITTVNGTDAFDAGTINISYE